MGCSGMCNRIAACSPAARRFMSSRVVQVAEASREDVARRHAVRAGAEVRNHTEALELEFAGGAVQGIRLRDGFSGDESLVACEAVINATGPWVDRFCAQSRVPSRKQLVGGVRGSHVVLPIFPDAPTNPVYTEAEDGRPIFLLPWNGQLLLGTTEAFDNGDPRDAAPSQAEIEYLFTALHRLIPNNGLTVR